MRLSQSTSNNYLNTNFVLFSPHLFLLFLFFCYVSLIPSALHPPKKHIHSAKVLFSSHSNHFDTQHSIAVHVLLSNSWFSFSLCCSAYIQSTNTHIFSFTYSIWWWIFKAALSHLILPQQSQKRVVRLILYCTFSTLIQVHKSVARQTST